MGDNKKLFGVEIPGDLKERLNSAASERMTSQGAIVRLALKQYLDAQEERSSKKDDRQ